MEVRAIRDLDLVRPGVQLRDAVALSVLERDGELRPDGRDGFVVTPSVTHVRAVGLVTSACAWPVAPDVGPHLNDPT